MPVKPFRPPLRLACLALVCTTMGAAAQPSRMPSHCIAIAGAAPGIAYLQPAAWTDPAPQGMVRLHYIGHSMFLIRTDGGLGIVTDYNGSLGATAYLPDVVTMNQAHSSHHTDRVEGVGLVLRGWTDRFGVGAHHHLDLGEVLIRNVPTDIRRFGTVEENGNSIFIFEAAGLCIAHLGHLHQEPSDLQYAALGRADVLMVPVDGSYTMDLGTMMRVVARLRNSLVLPMHWFSQDRLETFLAGMSDRFRILHADGSEVTVSLATLPDRPTVLVLDPAPLAD